MSPAGGVAEAEKGVSPEGVEEVNEKLRVAHNSSLSVGGKERRENKTTWDTATYFEDITGVR